MLGTMFWQTECRSSAPTHLWKTYFIIWTDQSSLKSACNAKTYNISVHLNVKFQNQQISKCWYWQEKLFDTDCHRQADLSTTKLLDQTTRHDQNKPNRKYIWLTIHALSIIHIVFWILTWYGILLKWHTSHIDLQVKTAWTSWGCLAPVINFLSGGQSGHMHHEAPHPNVCDIKIYIVYLYLYLYLGQFGHMHHDPVCVILR